MCMEKQQGGLGIKDVATFNKSLLGKWKWRILYEKESLWADLLRNGYENLQICMLRKKDRKTRNKESLWWRYLGMFDLKRGCKEDVFNNHICYKLGEGRDVAFWKSRWIGNGTFAQKFPSLLLAAADKEALILEFGCWEEDIWKWNFPILNLVDREGCGEGKEETLKATLREIHSGRGIEDKCVWMENSNKQFTVKSFYNIIMQEEDLVEVNDETKKVLSVL